MKQRRFGSRSTAVLLSAALVGVSLALFMGPGGAFGASPAPENVAPPSIVGVAREGEVLRADTGSRRPRPGRGTEYAYQWRLCDAGGGGCSDIESATDSIYPVRHDDIGHTLQVAVAPLTDPNATAESVKSSLVPSAPTAVVVPAPKDAPTATGGPVVAGTTTVGAMLRATPGTWAGAQPIRVRYRWRRCNPLGGSCRELRRQGATYLLRPGDVRHSVRVLVTAQNAAGASAALSTPTSPVGGTPSTVAPKPTAEPEIAGTPVVGNALHATNGAWAGTQPLRFAYQWRRCQGAGKPDASDCRRIDHASSAVYTLRRGDVGARLRVQVTATNRAGSATSTSNPTEAVAAPVPAKVEPKPTTDPTIAGTTRAGSTLRATHGRWVGTKPLSFASRWVRCGVDGGAPDGSNCASIPGADGSSYRLAQADVGKRLRIVVTASNDAGSAAAASNPTAVVQAPPAPAPAPPRNTREPAVVGNPTQGQTLAAGGGTWAGANPISLAYQWVRCGPGGGRPDGSNCPAIGGATASTYTLAAADVGHRLRVRVTAKNIAGSAAAASNATAAVEPLAATTAPPRETREPSIAGTPSEGQTLTASGGAWTGATPIALAYQWVRCGADGGQPDGSNCAPIPRATTTTYALTAADVGHRLRIRVTARNSRGTFTAASNATRTIAATGPSRPDGAVRLPSGGYSIPVSSVALPARLIVDALSFTPNPVRSRRTTIRLRVHVVDTRGYAVRNALVFARSTPLVTLSTGEHRTAMNGWVTLRLVPRVTFPIRNGYSVQFFVRARKPGENLLAGVSTRRLVQLRTHR